MSKINFTSLLRASKVAACRYVGFVSNICKCKPCNVMGRWIRKFVEMRIAMSPSRKEHFSPFYIFFVERTVNSGVVGGEYGLEPGRLMSDFAVTERQAWMISVLDEYEVPLARFVARLLGDETAAEDVVQFAFLKLCEQSPDELRGREAQWLFTVCRNKAIDTLRGRSRAVSLDMSEIPMSESNEPDPADVADRNDLYRQLGAMVDQLPTGQREALALWAEGFDYRQIAKVTGRRENSVRVMVHRAIKRLREMPVVRHLLADPPPPSEKRLLAR